MASDEWSKDPTRCYNTGIKLEDCDCCEYWAHYNATCCSYEEGKKCKCECHGRASDE